MFEQSLNDKIQDWLLSAIMFLIALLLALLVIGGVYVAIFEAKHPCLEYGPKYHTTELRCVGKICQDEDVVQRDCLRRQP